MVEDGDHIFFSCMLAQFLWGCIIDASGCPWKLASLGDFHTLSNRLSWMARRIMWLGFAAFTWALWQIRNKALIEGIFIKHPSDCLYKIIIILQLWRSLNKTRTRRPLRTSSGAFDFMLQHCRRGGSWLMAEGHAPQPSLLRSCVCVHFGS